MKKILTALVLSGFLVGVLVPAVALGQDPTEVPDECTINNMDRVIGIVPACDGNDICEYSDPTRPCGICCVLNTIITITNWIFVFLILLAVIFVLLGAFNLLTAAGNPEKIATGRNYVLYAAVGLLVAFLARAIPNLVGFFIG